MIELWFPSLLFRSSTHALICHFVVDEWVDNVKFKCNLVVFVLSVVYGNCSWFCSSVVLILGFEKSLIASA